MEKYINKIVMVFSEGMCKILDYDYKNAVFLVENINTGYRFYTDIEDIDI